MSSEEQPTFDRAFALFERVCDLEPDEQERVLAEQCGADARLRREVEELLAADRASDGLEAPPPGAEELLAATLDALPEHIGDYEVVGKIGEGGMGVVYEALQSTPRRRVALKLLRPGLMTAERLKRFEHEAQVLGWLNHPGIAQIYESGIAETEAGRQPFLAMELVRGERLDQWIERRALGLSQRLQLLARICDAVHHAHQKGVIHRDLKPANVLVDADGAPKILDFGVARITNADLEATTAQTVAGEILGTLAYMSPEQIRADPAAIDTRSDVYALGVLAYEAISGQRPYDVEAHALHEAARIIAEDEPTTLGLVDPGLRGDVEVLVSKAMSKEKERRYASAEEFASDIRRHLANEPILARRAGRLYRFRKFARRNRAVVAGLAAVFVVLVIGTAVSTTLFFRVREESRANAELSEEYLAQAQRNRQLSAEYRSEADAANQMVTFLEEIFSSVEPQDEALTARDLVDRSVERVQQSLDIDPAARGRLLSLLGRTYNRLGLYPEARPLLVEALELCEQAHGGESLEVAQVLERLAQSHRIEGDLRRSEELAARVLEIREALLGPSAYEVGEALNNLAISRLELGRAAEALELYERALSIYEDLARPVASATTRMNYAVALFSAGETERSLAMLEDLLAEDLELEQRMQVLDQAASLLKSAGRPVEAEAHAREVLALGLEQLGFRSSIVAGYRARLAVALVEQGRLAEPEELLLTNLEILTERHGEESAQVFAAKHELAYLYQEVPRFEEAEDLYLQAMDGWRRGSGERSPMVLQSYHNISTLYDDWGRLELAEEFARKAFELRAETLGPTATVTLLSMRNLGRVLRRAGKLDEAGALRFEHLERVRSVHGASSDAAQGARHDLATWLVQVGRHAEAEEVLLEAWGLLDRMPEPGRLPELIADQLAEVYGALGDVAEAQSWRTSAVESRERRADG